MSLVQPRTLPGSTESCPTDTLGYVRNRILLHTTRLIFLVALCLSSCRTAPRTAEAPRPTAKGSPAQEQYKKVVEDQLGPLWYGLAKIHEDSLHLGTVNTTFEIPAAGGLIRNLRVTSNTGGRMDELIARRAIDQLRAPPVPRAILARLHQDYIVFEESFTVYDNADRTPSATPPKNR